MSEKFNIQNTYSTCILYAESRNTIINCKKLMILSMPNCGQFDIIIPLEYLHNKIYR